MPADKDNITLDPMEMGQLPARPGLAVNVDALKNAAFWLMLGALLGLWLAKTRRL